MMFKIILRFFDKLEDRVRGGLSGYPLFYAFVGGAGVIIFWRGIWHTMDAIIRFFFTSSDLVSSTSDLGLPWWDGPLSVAIGMTLLLLLGLFVPSFIGNEIIISGIKGEKKLAEKSEQEIKEDVVTSEKIMQEVKTMSTKLEELKNKLS